MTAPHKNVRIGTPYRRKGSLWSLGFHTGDDWLTPTGTKALAMADGIVRATGYNASYGNHVIVETAIGRAVHRWSVNHLSKISVRTGQRVTAGQVLGLTGATGHVTGPHDHVEDRVYPWTFAAANFRDPQVMYDWRPAVSLPSWVRRRPAIAPPRWYRAVGWNLGGMNDHGRATFRTRAPLIVQDINELRPDVVGVQELANPEVAYFDGLMSKIGYKRVAGSDGRYIYVLKSTPVKWSGVFDLQPRYEGDDKQAAAAIVTVNGHDAVPVVGHLESDKPADTQRVGQARDQIAQATKLATDHGLSVTRIIHINDNNSDEWVRRQAFNEAHYVDAAEAAWKIDNADKATFIGWSGRVVKGPRIDGIFVHRARPVRWYGTRVRHAGRSDHLLVAADIGIIKA